MNQFSLAQRLYSLPESGCFSLPLDELGGEDGLLDSLLQELRRDGSKVAWLPTDTGLVSNLTLLENCLLPLHWLGRLPPAELQARCEQSLALLGLTLDEAGFLRQRPSQSGRLERQQALYLRVLLQQPQRVVLSSGALRLRYRGETAEALLSRCLSGSLLIYTGAESDWPALPVAEPVTAA
jgi:hypothetical protein